MDCEILTIGGLLVEVMRTGLDQPLDEAGPFLGPYPSGDVGIFIDTAARLGMRAGIIACVGDDAFGDCLLRRLGRDGVDLSRVRRLPAQTTGTAFVSYKSDGSRRFIYHWRHAAAARLDQVDISDLDLARVRYLHLTGCTLSINEASRDAVYRLLEACPASTLVGFDPNIRPEVLSVEQIRSLCRPVFERADLFFPSESEAMLFTGAESDDEGCRRLARAGKLVVLKRGAQGCRVYRQDERIEVPAFAVEEVDPTGAGDSFAAGFVSAYLRGVTLCDAARYANAVGALSVTKKGPMEGAPGEAELVAFLDGHGGRVNG